MVNLLDLDRLFRGDVLLPTVCSSSAAELIDSISERELLRRFIFGLLLILPFVWVFYSNVDAKCLGLESGSPTTAVLLPVTPSLTKRYRPSLHYLTVTTALVSIEFSTLSYSSELDLIANIFFRSLCCCSMPVLDELKFVRYWLLWFVSAPLTLVFFTVGVPWAKDSRLYEIWLRRTNAPD